MMNNDLVLTIDAGTGSLRAGLYSLARQCVVSVAARALIVTHPRPGFAEFDPWQMFQVVRECVRECLHRAAVEPNAVRGITVTSLRQAFVLLGRDARPSVPGVMNYDRRGADALGRLAAQIPIEKLYALTGHWLAP